MVYIFRGLIDVPQQGTVPVQFLSDTREVDPNKLYNCQSVSNGHYYRACGQFITDAVITDTTEWASQSVPSVV